MLDVPAAADPDQAFEDELERRLALLDDPASGEAPPADLPRRDVLLAALALAVLSAALVWWGYPA